MSSIFFYDPFQQIKSPPRRSSGWTFRNYSDEIVRYILPQRSFILPLSNRFRLTAHKIHLYIGASDEVSDTLDGRQPIQKPIIVKNFPFASAFFIYKKILHPATEYLKLCFLYFSKMATPGSDFPSIHSKKAPPAADT